MENTEDQFPVLNVAHTSVACRSGVALTRTMRGLDCHHWPIRSRGAALAHAGARAKSPSWARDQGLGHKEKVKFQDSDITSPVENRLKT